jgi:hypothetical protein
MASFHEKFKTTARGSFSMNKWQFLPADYHDDCKKVVLFFIFGEHVDMPSGYILPEIRNPKCLQGGCFWLQPWRKLWNWPSYIHPSRFMCICSWPAYQGNHWPIALVFFLTQSYGGIYQRNCWLMVLVHGIYSLQEFCSCVCYVLLSHLSMTSQSCPKMLDVCW